MNFSLVQSLVMKWASRYLFSVQSRHDRSDPHHPLSCTLTSDVDASILGGPVKFVHMMHLHLGFRATTDNGA